MLAPSAIASGTTMPRCSRSMRCMTVPPCASLATRPLRTYVDGPDDRLEQSLLGGLFRRRDDIAEAARLFERFDELVDVVRAAGLDDNLNGEFPLFRQRRFDARDAHIVRQRLLQLIEELRPRERALIDDAVGFARGAG